MNNIYKVIWSKAKNCYVVASEIARSHTKSASGSEKIGGGTRRKLLASLMALSLLCGGLGVAEASVHVDESGVKHEVYTTEETYTKTETDGKLALKADATDVATNTANIATNTANIAKLENDKLDKDVASDTYATKTDVYSKTDANDKFATKEALKDLTTVVNGKADTTALNGKADTATVTALDGRVGGVEGRVTTLETKVGDASGGLVKDVADLRAQGITLNTELGNKANQSDLDAAKNRITTNEGNITDLQKKTAKLSDDGKELTGMTTVSGTTVSGTNVEANALKVTGEISNGAGVTTTLAAINDSMTQTATNKTDIAALQTTTGKQQTAIDDLKKRTTKIDYDTATDTTSVNGMKVGQQVDMGGKNLTNVGTINGIDLGTKEGGTYIHQDNSIWGNMKKVDTQVKTNADNIETNKNAITTLDTKVGEIDDRTGGIKRNLEDTQTTIEGKVTVDNSGNVSGVKGLSAETINTTGDAKVGGTLGVTGATTLSGELTAEKNATFEKNVTVEGTTNLKNTTVTGDLKVTGTITTDKMIFGDKATQNYTEIDHGKVTSKNVENNGAGQLISSSSTFDAEEHKVGFVNSATGDQSFHKQTSDGIMDNVKDLHNSNNRTQTKTETKDIITDENGNSSTTSQTASENKTYLKDKDGKNTNSTVDTAKGYDKTIKGENGETSTKQDELNITNTAKDGTITNDAQNIVNKAATMDTNVTGKATESYGELDTTVKGNETHHVTGKQTNKIDGNQENTIGGNQTTNVTGDILNTAKNITNEATEKLTDKVGDNTRVTTSTSITDTVGTTTNRKIEDGKITDTAGDSTVVTENEKGTTFTKTGSAAYSTEAGAPTDTNIAGNHITTGRVDANELGVSDKDGDNTAKLTVKAGEDGGVKASAGNGTTTGSLDVTAEEVGSSVKDASGKGSTFKQRIGAIMGNVKTDAGESEVTQKGDEITSKVGLGEATNSRVTQKKDLLEAAVTDGTNYNISNDTANASAKVLTDGTKVNKLQDNLDSSEKTITNGTYSTSTVQSALDITHTAKDGTITHDAKDIVNNASNSITDKVGDHTRVLDGEGITDTVGGSTFKQRIDKIMMESKDVSIKAEETLTNEAKVITNKASEVINNEAININNTATGIITSKASEIKNQADKLISNKVGENTSEYMEDGKITTSVKDGAKSTVTIQNADGLQAAVTNGTSTNASATTATSSAQTIASGSKANSVITTIDGTQFVNSDAWAPVTGASGAGTAVNTTIKGNTITTGKVKMDYAEVMKDLGVHGNAKVDQNLEVGGTSTLKGDVTMESNATVKKDLTVEGTTTTKTLKVTEDAEVGRDLSVGGNATITGDVTANSYKVGDKTYISAAGINANDQKITNVADGSISEGSKDAVNGGQLYGVKRDLEHQVDKVGANAAAMANLRPMEFDPSSKWNIAAAIGNYGSETAAALGAFYRPNDNVMVNLSTAFGTGENMVGGGVSVRLGKGGNKLSREETNALKAQVADLSARMDALLSVLNPNMSKDFPDVPENHWAYEAVSRLAGNDIVQGYPDGEFHGERTMTRYEMAEIIYNALSRGAEAERELVEEFKPELQAMAASEKATAERAEG